MTKKMTFSEFLERAKSKHEGRYSYPVQHFEGASSKVTIECSRHGQFSQWVSDHLSGSKCPSCAHEEGTGKRRHNWVELLVRLNAVNGTYKYCEPQGGFRRVTDKISVTCPAHGVFEAAPHHLLKGKGCPECGKEKTRVARTVTVSEFVSRSVSVHGDRYDYSRVKLNSFMGKVEIVCREHGSFNQSAQAHAAGQGCPKCGILRRATASIIPFEEFRDRAVAAHGDTYVYFPEGYGGIDSDVRIRCKKHGDFYQRAVDHTEGSRCPVCAACISAGQVSLFEFVRSLCVNPIPNYRYGCGKKEVDIFVPDCGVAIEYDGLYFHSTKFKSAGSHEMKRKELAGVGIELIRIFEDEWKSKRKQVESLLKMRLGVCETSVYGRNCHIKLVGENEAKLFMDANHVQGSGPSGISAGLTYAGELVGVMQFTKRMSHRGFKSDAETFELSRFASSIRVIGGASKLFKYLVKITGARRVVSYSDKRLFSGALYPAIGFRKVLETAPSYSYVNVGATKRLHKSKFRRSRLPSLLGERFDPTKSERHNCEQAGFYQIYDCGLVKWEWLA